MLRGDTMTHTPGPWTVYQNDTEGIHIWGGGRGADKETNRVCEWVNSDADARLIMAAPDLLEALKDELTALKTWQSSNLRKDWKDVHEGFGISISKLEITLAKAKGRE